jgi:hypothetical protein
VHLTHRTGRGHLAGLTLALAAILIVGEAIAPVAAAATATTTVSVTPATTTINPLGSVGGTVAVTVKANAAVTVSGAGSALSFDKTRLQLTSLAKDATEDANGVTWLGFPSSGTMATFIAGANAAGEIPTIGWTYTDGSSAEPAATDIGLFSATFTVIAAGDRTLTPVIKADGGILDGSVATYGVGITIDSLVSGAVANALPTPPTGSITALPAWQASNALTVSWGGTPGTNPIATYDVRYRKAAYSGAFGAYTPWLSATALTTSGFATAPGYTYCFSELARDTLANVSSWTAETCTTAPLDDRSLTRKGSWSAKTGSAFYRSTYLSSTAKGAKLTRTGVKAKRIVLVATTCAKCGSVKVYWGTKLLKTVSLKSAKTVNRKLISITTFSSVSSGTLSIKVSTSGKKVMIDGVILSAR